MSASISPTRRPSICKARARFVDTVDLPTPPLPLATATRYLMFGSSICGGEPPGGGMTFSPSAFIAFPNRPQAFQRKNAGIVTVIPSDLIGVVPYRRDRRGLERLQFGGFENAQRIWGFLAFFIASGAGAVLTQMLPKVNAAMAVVPLNDQASV